MGNLLLDASSPTIVWNAVAATVASGSFTPPVGARLLVSWAGNSGGGNLPAAPTITNTGAAITWTLLHHSSRSDSPATDGQAAMWHGVVGTSNAMTVSVTNQDAATGGAIKVMAWTDDNGDTPTIGATKENGRATSGTSVSDSVTGTATGSRGVIAYADWDAAAAAPTAGTGCTLTGGGSASQSPTLTYAFALRSTADGVDGAAITMNLTTGTTAANRWVIAEVVPATGPAVGVEPAQWWPGAGPWGAERFVADPLAWDVTPVAPAEVTVTPAVSTWEAVSVTPTPGETAVTLTPASGAWSAPPVTPTPGAVAVTMTPSQATWTAVGVTATAQVALTPATSTWTAQTAQVTPVVSLAPATAVWASVAVTPTPGQVALTLTPATGSWTAIAVTPTPGATARTATPATTSWTAVAVTPAPQTVQLGLVPSTATWEALPGALQTSGGLTVLPAAASWTAVPVTPVPGQTARTVTPATGTWAAVPVVATPTLAVAPTTAVWSAVPVVPAPGQVARTITPAVISWAATPLTLWPQLVVVLTPAGLTWTAATIDFTEVGAPGYLRARTLPSGQTRNPTTSAAGGASSSTGARINGTSRRAGEVDGNVL